MSNKQLQRELDPCCHRVVKRFKQQKKHLYLILDDWERGYGVYKVDVDDFDSSDARLEPLPVVRFEARHNGSWFFAANGTKILVMQPSSYPAFPVFDIQTAALAVCLWPRPRGNEVLQKPLFASVAGSLYLLRGCHFDVLSAAPPPPNSGSRENAAWSWNRVPSLPPFDDSNRISSFAVHCSSLRNRAPSPSTPRARSGRLMATGSCLSKARPTSMARWMLGWASAATRVATATSARRISLRPPPIEGGSRPGSWARTRCSTQAPGGAWGPRSCTWVTRGTAWSSR